MNDAEFAHSLGFTSRWFELGLVDDEVLAALRVEWNRGEDANTEHYRYGVFRRFLANRAPHAPEMALALLELGAADPDLAMGGAIMADVVRLPECPMAVREAAMASGRPHLVRIVTKWKSPPEPLA